MTTLGENLKKIRKAKKMTQIQLAKKSGVKQSVISDLETGNAKSTGFILELANALGVTAEELKKGIVGEIESSNAVAVKARMAPVLSWVQAGTFTNVSAVDTSEIMADGRITKGEVQDMSKVIHQMHVALAELDKQIQACIDNPETEKA
jgi:transcriptional regulator with XRE-family HTH domain